MVDKDLELKIKRVKEFMQLWIKFHDMYKDSINRESVSPEDETNFLETKSLIARKYEALTNLLGKAVSYQDRTFDVVSQVLSLKGVSAISDLGLSKIENDWHNSYIQLNRILGELEGREDGLRKVSRMGLFLNRLFRNPLVNLALAIIVILGIYLLVGYYQKEYRAEEAVPEGKIKFRK